MGGEAVANGDDVSDWEGAQRLVNTAVETFGGLDVLVNNAGILRDRMLVNMTEEEWDAVIKVHLEGTFAPTRWAAAYWRERSKAGETNDARIINTSSPSGLYGNPGQTNYGAAKAGIASFTIIAAKELGRYGVTVNAIAPVARTRMTAGLGGGAAARAQARGVRRHGAGEHLAPRGVARQPRVEGRHRPGVQRRRRPHLGGRGLGGRPRRGQGRPLGPGRARRRRPQASWPRPPARRRCRDREPSMTLGASARARACAPKRWRWLAVAGWARRRPARRKRSPCRRRATASRPMAVGGTVADPRWWRSPGWPPAGPTPASSGSTTTRGASRRVTALSDTGADLGTYVVPGATATDWEDIAAGPGPDPGRTTSTWATSATTAPPATASRCTGSPSRRTAPDGADGRFAEDVVLTLRYPAGPVDAEALLVDPRTGDLVIVGKRADGRSRVRRRRRRHRRGRGRPPPPGGHPRRRRPMGGPPGPLGLVTGGDVSPDGSVVLLRTYLSVAAYARARGRAPRGRLRLDARAPPPRSREPQGEALGFLADGSAYVTDQRGGGAADQPLGGHARR